MQFFYSLIFNILTCISLIKEIDSHVHKKTFHGAETFDEFRQNILDYQSAISKATAEELSDEAWVTRAISAVGLYSEGDRKSAADSSRHIYGDDAIFQNKMLNTGLWQIPRQLAGYLIKLAFLGKQIESFVDVGTCRGATITVVTIYLQRFGLKWVETVDVLEYVDVSLQTLWKMMNLPITYHVTSTVLFPFMRTNYTAVFIDGHHDYTYVLADVKFYLNTIKVKYMTFHDINDIYCVDVRRIWGEVKDNAVSCGFGPIHNFTHHSHGDALMGIGLVELPHSDAPLPEDCFFVA